MTNIVFFLYSSTIHYNEQKDVWRWLWIWVRSQENIMNFDYQPNITIILIYIRPRDADSLDSFLNHWHIPSLECRICILFAFLIRIIFPNLSIRCWKCVCDVNIELYSLQSFPENNGKNKNYLTIMKILTIVLHIQTMYSELILKVYGPWHLHSLKTYFYSMDGWGIHLSNISISFCNLIAELQTKLLDQWSVKWRIHMFHDAFHIYCQFI